MSDFLKKVQSMSPQEVEEFHIAVDNDDQFASKVKESLGTLNKADQEAAKGLLFGQEAAQPQEVPEGQQISQTRDALEESETNHYEGSTSDYVHGIAQGMVSQLPFGDQILSGTEAMSDVVSGKSESLSEAYQNNVIENKEQIAEFSKEHPYANMATRGVSELAQFAAGMGLVKYAGLATKTASTFSKADKAYDAIKGMKFVGKALPAAKSAFLVDATLEASRTMSKDENLTLGGTLGHVGGALVLSGVADRASAVLGAGFKATKGIRSEAWEVMGLKKMKKMLGTFGIKKNIQKTQAFIERSINGDIGAGSEQIIRNIDDFYNVVEEAVKEFNPEAFKTLWRDGVATEDVLGASIKKLTKQATDALDGSTVRQAKELLSSPEMVKSFNGEEFLKGLGDDLGAALSANRDMMPAIGQIQDSTSLKGAYDAWLNLNKQIKNIGDSSVKSRFDKIALNLKTKVFNEMEDAAFSTGKQEAFDSLMRNRVKLDAMRTYTTEFIGTATGDIGAEQVAQSSKSLERFVYEAVNAEARKEIAMMGMVGGMIGGGIGYATGGGYGAIMGGTAGVAATFAYKSRARNLAKSFKSLAGLEKQMAEHAAKKGNPVYKELMRASKMGEILGANSNSKIIKGIANSMDTVISRNFVDNLDGEMSIDRKEAALDAEFNKHSSAVFAANQLLKEPMERTTESFFRNKEAFMTILDSQAPELAQELNDVLEQNENIGPTMEQLAKHPLAKEIMKDDAGWDGMIYSLEDRERVAKEVLNEPKLIGPLKYKAIKELRETGKIPNMEEMPRRQPKKYRKKQGRQY